MSLRRLLPAAALAALTTALAVVAGWPDLGRSLDLVTGRDVTGASEFAFIGLLCWLLLAVTTVVTAVDARAARQSHGFARLLWRLAIVTAAAALLVAGINRQQNEYRVCCASSSTAQQAEQLVP